MSTPDGKAPDKKTRVLVVEDSLVVQQLLTYIIGGDPRLEVAAIASSGEQALRLIERVKPDVVSLDIRLPGIDGFEVTSRIMRQHPTPIVVVASDVDDLDIPMRALQAGALAVVEKPGSMARADYDTVAGRLRTQLHCMSQVKVITQRFTQRQTHTGRLATQRPLLPLPAPRRYQALGLVASTGGPAALVKLLNGLPANFPMPIFIVQHIGAPFVAGFASWLGSVCPFPVQLGQHGAHPQHGRVHVAPGGCHMTVETSGIRLVDGDMVCGQKPAGDMLFSSLARTYGGAALGVLLTGMGEDGARGLLDMRKAGAYTIAEHASTAVIHGMPGTALQLGAALEELPLDKMANRLLELVSTGMEQS